MQRRTFLLLAAFAALGATVLTRMQNPEPVSIYDLPTPFPATPATFDAASPAPARPVSTVPTAAVPTVAQGVPLHSSPSVVAHVATASIATPPLTSAGAVRSPEPTPQPSFAPSAQVAPRQDTGAVAAVGRNPGGAPIPAPLAVELDRGVPLPVALIDEEEPLRPTQLAVKQQIADKFAGQIQEAVPTASADPGAFEDAWFSAHARANWEYQMFFGGEAANRAGMRAALEALAEP